MAESAGNLEQRVAAVEDAIRRIITILERGGSSADGERVTPDDCQSLSTKLDRLENELTPKEKAILLSVLGAAAATYQRAGTRESPAVSGPVPIAIQGALNRVKLSDGLLSIGTFQKPAVGGFGGGSPVADSVNVGGDFTSVHGDWTKDTGMTGDAMVRGRWNAVTAGAGRPGGLGQPGGFGQPAGGSFGGGVGGGGGFER
jgi:hypothetical protein